MQFKMPPPQPKEEEQIPQDCHSMAKSSTQTRTENKGQSFKLKEVAECSICALETTLMTGDTPKPQKTKLTPAQQAIADKLSLKDSILSNEEKVQIIDLMERYRDLWDCPLDEQIIHTDSAKMEINLTTDRSFYLNYRTQDPVCREIERKHIESMHNR
jgi:hypothetical protein